MPRYGHGKPAPKIAPRLADDVIAELRRDYSDDQIEALMAMDGQRLISESELSLRENPRPAVQLACICPPNHEGIRHAPNKDGFIITSPSCLEHGCRSRYLAHGSSLNARDFRTVGAVHARRGSNG
jgi:hypothetical protein